MRIEISFCVVFMSIITTKVIHLSNSTTRKNDSTKCEMHGANSCRYCFFTPNYRLFLKSQSQVVSVQLSLCFRHELNVLLVLVNQE